MDWSMIGAAQTGNINVLYELIQKDPYVLERIDHVSFLDTPLHVAASAGHVDFMMEMINLKPSFARKLNQAGFSPMHLALQNNRTQAAALSQIRDIDKLYNTLSRSSFSPFITVLRLLKFDEGLVRVKGRGGLTPLHHVAQTGDVDLLIKFLEHSKSWWGGRHEAAQRWEKEQLSCADIDGNTVLHIAAIENPPQVVKVLLGHLRRDHINGKNLKGSTALDIQPDCPLDERQMDNYKGSVKDMIRKVGGLSGSELPNKSISSIHIKLWPKLSCFQKIATMAGRGRKGIPLEMRNTFLVVIVLIIIATYAASLSPPEKADNSSSMKYHIKYYVSLKSADSTAPQPGPPPLPADYQINFSDIIDLLNYHTTQELCRLPRRETLSSVNNDWIHIISATTWARLLYSVSAVDRETTGCFLEL
ncbi:ankyrin repeat-containing protein BDA1-like [Gossypium hirsutum]|uniref:Ankyrin repeat-containing protein BDA1-like n=1 Tax=Gossypium hirsutum TaxID=3635 RepID=A0A1U8IED4_GOSHI|nr:ankyrin repeat-containing protein BDA1-like [Gossypium hirsutum]